jgi:hypothetical protein
MVAVGHLVDGGCGRAKHLDRRVDTGVAMSNSASGGT